MAEVDVGAVDEASDSDSSHADEPHASSVAARHNWLRAGVLGANDGIISTAGLVVGVAAATSELGPLVTAGVAGLVAGAVSMALGEYVSVSSQRDSELALIAKERGELRDKPEEELAELTGLLRQHGLSEDLSHAAAAELTERDALKAHLAFELNIDPSELANPRTAAITSAVAFCLGALVPLVAILLPPTELRIVVTFVAVVLGLLATGWISAHLGDAPKGRAIVRLVAGGILAMAVTFGVGSLLGATVL